MRQFITDHLSSFLRSIESLGGNADRLNIESPATEVEVTEIEKALGRPLPPDLRQFASNVSRRIAFRWYLPDSLFDRFSREAWSTIPDHERGRAGWQAECFPNAKNRYDVVWHNKLGLSRRAEW